MSGDTMNVAQYCGLGVVLSVLVYYLTLDTLSTQCAPKTAPQPLGVKLSAPTGKQHVLVTGGAGYIGSHAALRLLKDGHAVTVLDNLSRGNRGAVDVLTQQAGAGQFQFVEADLGEGAVVRDVFQRCHFDTVMHFAAVAYVGESMAEPLRYYHNITANVVNVLEGMKASSTRQLVFSSTCATYGNPAKLPVTEETPTLPINPYGRAKLMAEQVIRDYLAADATLNAVVFRYFNVYGSDPGALLGEYPRPELRKHARITGACMDAAMHEMDHLTITGTQHPTRDGTCIRDFIHVADLIDAHVLGLRHLHNPAETFNIGTGRGTSVRELVEACKAVTGEAIRVVEQAAARPGDYAEIWADPAKIERVMGWHAKYTNVEESLAHAWAWRQKHPHGYPRAVGAAA